MANTVQTKMKMRSAAEAWNKAHPKDPLTVPHVRWTSPFWGAGAKRLAWRLTSKLTPKHPSDLKRDVDALLFPPSPAEQLRARIVSGYHSIMGAKEGSATQKAIAAFCGLSHDEPWCAETFWYVAKKLAGYDGPRPDNIAYVPSWENFAKAKGIIVAPRNAKPGMGVTFVWDGRRGIGTGDHIGVMHKTGLVRHKVRFNPRTDEGNASTGSGDAVVEATRYWWQINCVFDIAKLQK